MAVWNARHNTDRYLVLGCLHGAASAAHLRYLGKRTRFPIKPRTNSNGVDSLFAELQGKVPNPPWRERLCQAWISSETWNLINNRIAPRQRKDQRSSRTLRRRIKESLQEDRRQILAEAGSAVESFLASDPPLIQEACIRMKRMVQGSRRLSPIPRHSVHRHHDGRSGWAILAFSTASTSNTRGSKAFTGGLIHPR